MQSDARMLHLECVESNVRMAIGHQICTGLIDVPHQPRIFGSSNFIIYLILIEKKLVTNSSPLPIPPCVWKKKLIERISLAGLNDTLSIQSEEVGEVHMLRYWSVRCNVDHDRDHDGLVEAACR